MEKQKLIELLRKAYLSGIMEKELADKMVGFKHDFEGMATHYAEIEVNNGVLDGVKVCLHPYDSIRIDMNEGFRYCNDCKEKLK